MANNPVNVTVNSSKAPSRISAFSESFTIINSSTVSTVWVGDDPSVHTGTGIKLAPLASARRIAGVETYVILDTGSTVPASLLLSFTIDQYQDPYSVALALQNSGLILVDNPVSVIPATTVGPGTTSLPSASTLYDVRTLQSVYLDVTTNIGAVAHTITVTLLWYSNINAIPTESLGGDRFGWANTDVWPLVGRQIPVRGSYLRVQVDIAGAGASDQVALLGSYRPWTLLGMNVGDRVLASGINVALATGASITTAPQMRYDGPVQIGWVAFGGAAAGPIVFQINDLVTGRVVAAFQDPALVALGTSRSYGNVHCIAPRNSWNFVLGNLSAGNTNIQFQATAAPEGT